MRPSLVIIQNFFLRSPRGGLLQLGAAVLLLSGLFAGLQDPSSGSLDRSAAAHAYLVMRTSLLENTVLARDGAQIYEDRCATCHGLDGTGIAGVFPPLTGTHWVTGDKGRLLRIILHGMHGEVEVKGTTYNSAMPAWGNVLNDQEVAEVATFVRSSWSNHASEVSTNEVALVRAATRARTRPWTAEELQQQDNTGIPSGEGLVEAALEEEPGPAHPYPVELPAIYRTFMPESSPASIAVGLPGGESYCFDAGVSYLRYAWQGGFVDNSEHWDGNGNAFSDIIGEVYYRNAEGFPLRIGAPDRRPEVAFKGYRLVDGGYPEFHYTADGVEVRELIKPRPDGRGLERRFRVGTLEEPLWFAVGGEEDGVVFEASAGTREGKWLRLTPEQAARFSIAILRTSSP